jgi:hypothetical protein
MSRFKKNPLRRILRSKLLSPGDLVVKAALIALVFGVCELGGLREHTTIISGTTAAPGAGAGMSAVWAATYLVSYFAFVLAAPILLLAAALVLLVNRWWRLANPPSGNED